MILFHISEWREEPEQQSVRETELRCLKFMFVLIFDPNALMDGWMFLCTNKAAVLTRKCSVHRRTMLFSTEYNKI